MKVPDLTDTDKMILIGKITVLRKARREVVQRFRDKVVTMQSHSDFAVNTAGIIDMVHEIEALNAAFEELN